MTKTHTIQILISALKEKELSAEHAHKVLLLEGHPVSKRTVYRYLNDLEDMELSQGEVCSKELPGAKKTWYLKPNQNAAVTEHDKVSLDLMRGLNNPLIKESRSSSYEKIDNLITNTFSTEDGDRLEDLDQSLYHHTGFGTPLRLGPYQHLDKLINAATTGQKVIFHELVDSSGFENLSNGFWHPAKVLSHRNEIYIGLVNDDCTEIDVLNIQNLSKVSYSEDKATDVGKIREFFNNAYRSWFGVRKARNPNIQHVEVLISESMSGYFQERSWHFSQKLDYTAQGLVLNFYCQVCPEMIEWLYVNRKHLKVLKPESLKAQLQTQPLNY